MRYGPKIVTDGLILCYDAADNLSAPSSQLPVKQGCVAWLDGADDDVFTYSSGTLVSEWRDKSGKGNHVANGTATDQPSRNATLNSKSVVNFDGTDDYLQSSASLDLSSGHTMFAVVNCDNGSSDAGLISINGNLSNGITIHNGGTAYFYYGSGGYHTTQSTGGTGVDNIFTKVWNGTTSGNRISYKNGTQGTSSGTMSSSHSTGVYRLGKQTTYLDGKIAEIIIYERILTDAEITKVHNYLQNKWGKAVSDAKWYDMTANAYNGTPNSAPAYVEDVHYSNKSSFNFDGSDDFITAAFGSGRNPYSSPMSFLAWVKSDTTTNNKMWLDHGSNGTNQRLYSALITADNTAPFGIQNSAWSLPSNADTSKWYHQAIVMDAGTARGYYDGIAAGTKSYTSYTLPGNTRAGGRNSYNWDGQIACFAVYDKALSAAEVKQNFEATRQRFGL
tara:strand:- start:490 stop:1827 length:1338 start_codon:yes stop_codon:yes gene_type:complete